MRARYTETSADTRTASVYPGPIGSVLMPLLGGEEKYGHLPFASSLCTRVRKCARYALTCRSCWWSNALPGGVGQSKGEARCSAFGDGR